MHKLSANKRVIKTDKFQFYMHPVTVSLLNSLGDACSMGSWVVQVHKLLAWLKKMT